jgi:hypothetical protein
MAMQSGNFDKLREAGVILSDDCPDEYRAVVEGLGEYEMDVILAVKRRLDWADRARGERPPDPGQRPAFTNCMVF